MEKLTRSAKFKETLSSLHKWLSENAVLNMDMGNFVIAVYCRNGNHRSVCLGAALHYALVATPDQVMAPPAVTNITEWAGLGKAQVWPMQSLPKCWLVPARPKGSGPVALQNP